MAEKFRKADFNLEDFLEQLQQVKKIGSMESILGMMPGMSGVKIGDGAEKQMARTEAIIKSMTIQERRNPALLNGTRRMRIAKGAGVKVVDVNQLLKQFQQMQKVMKMMKGGGAKKLMRQMEAMRGKGGPPGFGGLIFTATKPCVARPDSGGFRFGASTSCLMVKAAPLFQPATKIADPLQIDHHVGVPALGQNAAAGIDVAVIHIRHFREARRA